MASEVKQHDTVTMTLTVKDGTGAPINLSTGSPSVKVIATNRNTQVATILSSTISDAANGKVQHTFNGTLEPATYDIEVEVTQGGVVATAPTGGYGSFTVIQDLG